MTDDPHTEPAAPRAGRPWLTSTVLGFSLASLFSDTGHELVTSLMPGFLAALGAPPIALGVVEGVSNLGQNLAKLWAGPYADSARRRRPVVTIGYAATALKALFAVATSWWGVLALRTLGWIGRGARGPVRDATIADTVDAANYGKAFGFREAMDTIGAVAGPLAAALLVGSLGYRPLFWWSLVPAILAIVSVVLLVHEPHRPAAPAARPPLVWGALPQPFRALIVAATAFAIGDAAPTFFILRAGHLLGGTLATVATAGMSGAIGLYVVHNVFYAAGALPGGAWADRVGPRRVLAAGYVIFAAAMAGFALGPRSVWGLVPLFVLTGTAVALVEVQQSAWSSKLLPERVRGTGLGVLAACLGGGMLISNVTVGWLWTWLGAGVAFAFAACFSVLGALLLARVRPGAA